MDLIPTSFNRNLAQAVENRVAAEMSYISGRSGFWRAVGVGLLAFGVGSAIGLGLYGYSYISRATDKVDAIASAISKAMADVQIRGSAVGSIDIQPHEINLAKGQTVTMDNTATVRLDPSAKILVDGDVRVQTPTVSVPQTLTPRAKTTVPTITNFTVFKSVPFEKGVIQTGWVFLTSAQRSPTAQYCYYTESGENPDLALRIDIGQNEQVEDRKAIPAKFDAAAAFAKCVWFKREAK
jgi:hypothetical protein